MIAPLRDTTARALATLGTMRARTFLPLSSILFATGCTFTLPTSSAWNWYMRIGIEDRTASTSLTIDCPGDAAAVRMTSDIRVEQGTLHMRLFDPQGTCRLDETLRAGGRTGTLLLPPHKGTWHCDLDYQGFGGDCTIELAAGSAEGWTFTVEPTAVTVSPR